MAKRMTKAARKTRFIRVLLIIIIVLALLASAIGVLRSRVTARVNERNDAALTATVTRGSISSTVSGYGNLADEDVEDMLLHSGVEIDETVVEAGDSVEEGELLATVNMATVLSAMADVQTQINELDDEIGEASGDELDDSIESALAGRVMKIYAAEGDDVSTVMYEHGALAIISLDGYMALDLESDALKAGDAVTVTGSDGTVFEGEVESLGAEGAHILIPDEKAVFGDSVSVTDPEGNTLGTAELYVNEPMNITGIAGTLSRINVKENQKIYAGKALFQLRDTSFSANYTSMLEERKELEEQLLRLVRVYQDGAVLAPISGIISAVGEETSTSTQSSYSSYGGFSMNTAAQQTETTSAEGEQVLLSICPGTKMTVSISVDETDILTLAQGQTASVSIDALDDAIVEAEVTEIDTTSATASGGVTVYTVTVTLDKIEGMLSGMSASVSIVIEGVEDALLIPSDALTQTSTASYVYTSIDSETGELTGMTEVTTGLNNGDYVEITDGLSEGDSVCYFEDEDSGFSFGGMGGFGGMNGGNMQGGMDFGGMQMPSMGGGMSGGMPGRGQ